MTDKKNYCILLTGLLLLLVSNIPTAHAGRRSDLEDRQRLRRLYRAEISKIEAKIKSTQSKIDEAKKILVKRLKEEATAKKSSDDARAAYTSAFKAENELRKSLAAKYQKDLDFDKSNKAMIDARAAEQKIRVKMVAILNATPEYKEAVAAQGQARKAAKEAALASPPNPDARKKAAEKLIAASSRVSSIENSVLSKSTEYVAATEKAKKLTQLVASITREVQSQVKSDPTRLAANATSNTARATSQTKQREYFAARKKTSVAKAAIARGYSIIRSLNTRKRRYEARLRAV